MNPFAKKSTELKPVTRNLAFSVYDEKAQAYNLPFFYPQIGLAERSFTDMVKNPQSVISRHPEDFSLYLIGSYSDLDGKMQADDVPTLIVRASQIITQLKEQATLTEVN